MSSTLIIALVVVAIVLAAFFLARRRPELPPSPSTPRQETAAPARERRREPSREPAARERRREPSREPAPRDTAVSLPAEEVIEEGRVSPPPPPPPKPRAPSGPIVIEQAKPSAEDVASLKKGLASTRGGFIARLTRLFAGRSEYDPALLDQLEEVLITADVGVRTTQRILDRLRERMSRNELNNEQQAWAAIRAEARSILDGSRGDLVLKTHPAVVLVIGVNGVGKTTTTGKLASRLSSQGKKVLLVAADTFRAAAVLQLEVWGKRIGCEVARGKQNADPSSVVFDALKRAQSDNVDVVLIDTAGRLHTKAPLMEELKKIARTIEKALGHPADEVLLVLDSTNGQNALQQATMFRETVSVSGIVLTKLDGTAKGGVVLGIVDEHKLPIRFIGIGERVEDLRDFDPESFASALFERSDSIPPAG